MVEHITSDIEKSTEEITYKRALSALPILVRQVFIAQRIDVNKDITMTYGELGEEINAHHRGGVVPALFCIEKLLVKLGEHWEEEIPAIQGIVVNQETDLPGNSVTFLRDQNLDEHMKKKLVTENLTEVIKYQKWTAVLEELGLRTPEGISRKRLQAAAQSPSTRESCAHKQLKDYIAQNPQCVGLGKSLAPGKTECRLPSGDIPDVLFKSKRRCIAVEVKSDISNEDDLRRGLFQCVKYRAILEACQILEIATYQVDALLAIEGKLPTKLISDKKLLNVKVFENIQVSNV